MMYVTSASGILLCKETCSNSYEVAVLEREHAAPTFIWHARGSSVTMMGEGCDSDIE